VSAADEAGPAHLVLRTEAPANGGSCVARHDGRVVFVRYALPGELVRARVSAERGSYWHADAIEVLEASADRVESLCPVAGPDGAGCCDLAFVEPAAGRAIKGQVVGNQLARLGNFNWEGLAEPVGSGAPRGWRTRVQLDVGDDGCAGLHRYHSTELVTDLRCAQLPAGMLAGLDGPRWQPGDRLHVVLDDDNRRHVLATGPGRWHLLVPTGSRAPSGDSRMRRSLPPFAFRARRLPWLPFSGTTVMGLPADGPDAGHQ
jgi:predicted RNA-binding protein with TRAM domain